MASEVPAKCGPGHSVLRPLDDGCIVTKRVPFTKTEIRRAIAVAHEAGLHVVAIDMATGRIETSDRPIDRTQTLSHLPHAWGEPKA
jgi:hypothetical protein